MKKTNIFIFIVALIVFSLAFMFDSFHLPTRYFQQHHVAQKTVPKQLKQNNFAVPSNGIHELMGRSEQKVLDTLGKPERIDSTQYGYNWWVYGQNTEKYLQVGIEDHHVVTIYALGNKLHTEPFKIGTQSDNLYKKMTMSDTLSLKQNGTSFEFELSEDEMMVRPLVHFGDYWVQLYFDHFNNKLMCVRYLNTATLIKLRPYTIVYRGQLAQQPVPTKEAWEAIEQGEEREIFEMTNIIRKRHRLLALQWNNQTAQVAFNHSKEMAEKGYFSHDSPVSGSLGVRFQRYGIPFTAAGENIAAKYVDGIAALVGWMNSEGHRKNILNNMFSHVGVGVYREEYTQDFLTPIK